MSLPKRVLQSRSVLTSPLLTVPDGWWEAAWQTGRQSRPWPSRTSLPGPMLLRAGPLLWSLACKLGLIFQSSRGCRQSFGTCPSTPGPSAPSVSALITFFANSLLAVSSPLRSEATPYPSLGPQHMHGLAHGGLHRTLCQSHSLQGCQAGVPWGISGTGPYSGHRTSLWPASARAPA